MYTLAHHIIEHFQGVVLVTWLLAVRVVRVVHAAPAEAFGAAGALALDIDILRTGPEWVTTTIVVLREASMIRIVHMHLSLLCHLLRLLGLLCAHLRDLLLQLVVLRQQCTVGLISSSIVFL